MHLSIVIPAYNEAQRIRATLAAYGKAVRDRDAELVIVVNGSHDDTEHILRTEFLPRLPALRIVVIPERVGKGGALMRGMAESRGDLVAFTDADGSTPPEALFDLVQHLHPPGAVIGSRWLPGSRVGRPQPLSRRLASRLFNLAVRLLFGFPLTDTQCGAKVLSRDVVDTVLPRLGATQWAFDVELLFHIRRAGFPIHEVPTVWNDVGGSKIRIARASGEMTLALLRLRMMHSPLRPLVHLWDRGPGRKLFQRRMERLRSVYRPPRSP